MCCSVKCIVVSVYIISIQIVSSIGTRNSKLLYSEQEIVDELVKKWSPLVWLAPNEKFLPGNVKTFLENVHAEREKPSSIKDIGDNLNRYSQYYDDLVYYDGTSNSKSGTLSNRRRRNFEKDTSLEYIFELPIDDASEHWFLVTNEEIDNLIKNKSSFIYGDQNLNSVPVYAVVNMCSSDKDFNIKNEIDSGNKWKKNPYIPLTKSADIVSYNSMHIQSNNKPSNDEFKSPINEADTISINEIDTNFLASNQHLRRKRSEIHSEKIQNYNFTLNETQSSNDNASNDNSWKAVQQQQPNVIIYMKDEKIVLPTAPVKSSPPPALPHFHVSYWMFYPYSQGKSICTLNLVGIPIPIPLIFNMCFGTRKEFGSHVGDWEHISMFFRGKMEPDEMYVSVHDAGAYYTFSRLTNTFEFKTQETREGILQRPIFPKTVITSDNHPVLFAAEGSHGLWASPGKHRFVRVPRLYDVNGFGEPWQTWNNIEVIYNSDVKSKRSINPNWMKYKGRWGNPKNKCHPLKRIGLHVCEQADGPNGIPTKTSHFSCPLSSHDHAK